MTAPGDSEGVCAFGDIDTWCDGEGEVISLAPGCYICAPIALFYWNPTPPPGFPPQGALQPIAIQLAQQFEAETAPIFTPNDCAGANDANRLLRAPYRQP